MNAVLRLYPKAFRDRYGDEIIMLLESSPTPRRDLFDVVWQALLDRAGTFFHGGWRRTPRYLLYAVAWLLGAYAATYLFERAASVVLQLLLSDPRTVLPLKSYVTLDRIGIVSTIAVVSVVAYLVGWRFWRGSPWGAVAGLALTSIFAAVVQADTYVLSSIRVSVQWDQFWLNVAAQAIWVAGAVALVVLLGRTRRPGLVAPLAVAAFAYANSVAVAALTYAVYSVPANPWADYWRSIGGSVLLMTADGRFTTIAVLANGWRITIATALVAGCTLAALRVRKTAQSAELAS